MKLRWRVEMPAAPATSIWLNRRRSRQPRKSAPVSGVAVTSVSDRGSPRALLRSITREVIDIMTSLMNTTGEAGASQPEPDGAAPCRAGTGDGLPRAPLRTLEGKEDLMESIV